MFGGAGHQLAALACDGDETCFVEYAGRMECRDLAEAMAGQVLRPKTQLREQRQHRGAGQSQRWLSPLGARQLVLVGLFRLARKRRPRKDEFVHSPVYKKHFVKHSHFYLANTLGRCESIELDHELLWLTLDEALAQLKDGSHRWAVTRFLDLASRGR